ncbi:mannosyl-glycoprotein endo-beta-N-acetylglucosamidase [Salinicola corii]|uniref:Mannosyl-glycoprotein endo-beta-N-acetylglucosamidase n=1 Tax=Salinicola corii TaxID=2606937 RepID=A0A640W9G0_9GAMM|nr:glucosaminidase domain-containing protein [Salinicola corii]KAA0016893.1 mannosyl-glycoprotein endo-beta-N-acetylglucosamidase [Salinicola corii]
MSRSFPSFSSRRQCRQRARPDRLRRAMAAITGGILMLGVAIFPIASSAESLSETVTTLDARIQPPALDPVNELPNLNEIKAGPERKAAFLSMLVPLVQAENARIQSDRNWLVGVRSRINPMRPDEKRRLARLCDDYGVTCAPGEISQVLLSRVNTVPLEMVVIQAVEESGWGTSRLARESNNLFGMRCFSKGCGIAQRGTSRRFQIFDSVRDGVGAYLHNLNTHRAYAQLRDQRAALAARGKSISAEKLIGTLHNYSTSSNYQQQLLSLLRTNGELIRDHGIDDPFASGSPA